MPAADLETRLVLDDDHDALAVAHGTIATIGDPAERRRGNELLRARRTPAGPATVWLRQRAATLEARFWGPGSAWAFDQLPRLIGLDDCQAREFCPTQLEGAAKFAEPRPQVIRIGASDTVFEACVGAILGQKVVGKEAAMSYRAMSREWGEAAPGPGKLRLPPAPRTLLAHDYAEFHRFGIERRRAQTVLEAARSAHRLEEIPAMERGAATERLRSLPGVGAWTTALVRVAALGDPDAVLVGDYHLPNLVTWNLAGEPRGSDRRMLELLEPYRGHRARVLRWLKRHGRDAPRYGPRLEFRRVERW